MLSHFSHVWLFVTPMDCSLPSSSVHGILQARALEWVAFLSPGIFLTQGLNSGLPHCRQVLYHLSHQGSPNTIYWTFWFWDLLYIELKSQKQLYSKYATVTFSLSEQYFPKLLLLANWLSVKQYSVLGLFTLTIKSHIQGKEQWLCFAGAAVKRYPTSKVRETQVRR